MAEKWELVKNGKVIAVVAGDETAAWRYAERRGWLVPADWDEGGPHYMVLPARGPYEIRRKMPEVMEGK